jgi:hypothetical protein
MNVLDLKILLVYHVLRLILISLIQDASVHVLWERVLQLILLVVVIPAAKHVLMIPLPIWPYVNLA